MRNLIIFRFVTGALFLMLVSLTSCGNSNNNAAKEEKEKAIEQNMRIDSARQDHTAVADSAQHNGGMSVGGK